MDSKETNNLAEDCNAENRQHILRLEEGFELMSAHLSELGNAIVTISLGLKSERYGEQVVDSLESIRLCTVAIKQIADEKLIEIQKLKDNQ